MDRIEQHHGRFLERVAAGDLPPGPPPEPGLDPEDAALLFRAQCLSRAFDREARAMQRRGEGFYTIGSSGHEAMAAVAHAVRPDDIAFLHYRDAAFQIARAFQLPGQDPARDLALSFACSAEDPISGGRHKVLGSRALMIPPQTSTIASHLPKAVGTAFSIPLARRNPPRHKLLADDAIVIASFGDASLNHASAQAAVNAAGWAAFQSMPLPLLFVCEDNGIGISVRTPRGWVEAAMRGRAGWHYIPADGRDLYATYAAARRAAGLARGARRPVFLHLRTVRLFGHAGSDVEEGYLSPAEIESAEADDPLLHSVRLLDEAGVMRPAEALQVYRDAVAEAEAAARAAAGRPRLETAAEVMATILPPSRPWPTPNRPDPEDRARLFGRELGQQRDPQPMNRHLNWALHDLMLAHPETVLMGEDVGRKGGVYGVTRNLQARFGPGRVIDTLLDETTILGLAIGMAHNGFIPIPEIQFLAYLHNAEDQLRGEAATLPFFSQGQFTNPMVVRIAGLGYQKGFGGHFHNDNSLAVLRDIPGLILACPSRPADAARMLRTCHRLAREENRLVAFLEPIALYNQRDLFEPGDGLWAEPYPPPESEAPFGEVAVAGTGSDLAIVSYGNGRRLAEQAAKTLAEGHGIAARVIDLRWLAPLPTRSLALALDGIGAVLVVDECRRSGNVSEALMTFLSEAGIGAAARLTAEDSFIATGPAHAATLPSAGAIVAAGRRLVENGCN